MNIRVPSEAAAKTVKQLCELVVDCPHSTPKWTMSGVVVLRSRNIRKGRLNLAAQPSFTTEEGYEERVKRAVPQGGDLVITREAPMGEVCMLPSGLKCCMGQRMVLLRPNPEQVVGRFLLFALQSHLVQFQIGIHEGTGSTVSNLRIPALEALTIPWFPLDEQRRIAAVLGALDDKIELNRKMNRTLEEMAQAIFKSWFIDFAGVPDVKMVESELGPIPKGWEVKRGDEVAAVAIGKTPPRKEPHWFSTREEDIRWMSIKDMGDCGAYISETSEFLTPAAVERFNVRRIPENTVVLSFKLTVGRVAITVGEMLSNEAIAHFCLSDVSSMTPEYLYSYLSTFRYESLGSTSSIARAVNSKMIKAMPILVPPDRRISEFTSKVVPMFLRMKHLQAESRTLADLRDALLPRLISGEIRVPEAEEVAEAVL